MPTTDAQPTAVSLSDVAISVAGRLLLSRTDACFPAGKVSLIVGPSGAGKSMLLRVLAGLVDPLSQEIAVQGTLTIGQQTVAAASRQRPPMGVVFQGFALFDELSPEENVRFAAAHRSAAAGEAAPLPKPRLLLDELRVPRGVRTSALSGGQRQRLAIARTLAYDPAVILYDEPTSGLDLATSAQVAHLIQATHATHPKTSIIVTHDYESLSPIADHLFLFDARSQSLGEIARDDWPRLAELLAAASPGKGQAALSRTTGTPSKSPGTRVAACLRGLPRRLGEFLVGTSRVAERLAALPLLLVPLWKSPVWGLRSLLHYLRLVAAPSAWFYMAVAGVIVGFVSTYFTFKFLPYRQYTEPLVLENLLQALGFALYRILAPVLATILIAARCGAAVASDIGGKVYGQQFDALRSFGIRPERYLLTGILYAFLLGTPLLTAISFAAARLTSLAVFTATHPELGPFFWRSHFHRELLAPGQWLYQGTGWLLAKVLCCAAGMGWIAYERGRLPKHSTSDVSRGITSNILWSTLFVLVVHFAFAFYEF
jgi:ABC-type transporter Mla maintaining outer membrane lipid asymmetry ATPase subunit MlaF/ABC-type transporter Mla maintaining outer membrane lipid asymmetry permease subunit MlaE